MGGPSGLGPLPEITALLTQGWGWVPWNCALHSGCKLSRGETLTYFSVKFEPEEMWAWSCWDDLVPRGAENWR